MRKSPFFAGRAMSGAIHFVSVCLTLIFISIGWILFNLDPNAVKGSFGI